MLVSKTNTMHVRTKCVIILSAKSSGSSALQNLLVNFLHARHVSKTRHYENETLFWTKAASVLGLPQTNMLDSEVPINPQKAKSDLIKLLTDNLDSYEPPSDNNELIFGGFNLLCHKYSPLFVEKSPHHLHQWSALELISECIERVPEVDFLIIGLVRNPMDALYSMWKRYQSIPEKNQYEWLTAYSNLLKFRDVVKDRLLIVRYEDMVHNSSCLEKICKFIGASGNNDIERYLHNKSIRKWSKDKYYGFQLSGEVMSLAGKFGYHEIEMSNESTLFWPFNRFILRNIYRTLNPIKSILRTAKRKGIMNIVA